MPNISNVLASGTADTVSVAEPSEPLSDEALPDTRTVHIPNNGTLAKTVFKKDL